MPMIDSRRLRDYGFKRLWGSDLSIMEKLKRSPLRLIPSGTRVRVLSGINRNKRWIIGASNHSCWLGTYERTKQALVTTTVKPGMCVWDIGANVGFYTIAFASKVGPTGSVVAFEPSASNVVLLMEHVRENALPNVQVVQAAVGDSDKLICFSDDAENSIGRIESYESTYKIPCVSLDAFAHPRPPDIIKVDVEGAEVFVLRGAKNILAQKKTVLWIALHGKDAKSEVSSFLSSMEYQAFDLHGNELSYPVKDDEIVARPR